MRAVAVLLRTGGESRCKRRERCSRSGGGIDFDPEHVICSQIGLLLCYVCSLLCEDDPESEANAIDPCYCTPAELFSVLSSHVVAHPWSPAGVTVRADVTPDMLKADVSLAVQQLA